VRRLSTISAGTSIAVPSLSLVQVTRGSSLGYHRRVTSADESGRHAPRLRVEWRERETVKPLELYFDLVFVLAFTQCTALMSEEGTWVAIARGCLVLAILWWCWTAFAWLTSVIDPEEGPVRLVMIGTTAALLVTALCVPGVFGERALTFAIAYGVVRFAHIVLFLIAGREDAELRHSLVGIAMGSAVGVGLLIAGSFLEPRGQTIVWTVAIVLDLAGGLFRPAGWKLVTAHFAERHNLVIILALGESIVALGVGSQVDLTTPVIVAAVLGVLLSSALWWTYFDVVSIVTEQRLSRAAPGPEQNRLARDSYSYLHLLLVAGIILAAFGLESTLHHVDEPLDGQHAFALLGGVAIYLLGHVALRLRNAHTLNVQRFVLACVLFAAIPLATRIDAMATLIGANVLLWLMIAYETHRYGTNRYALRHGVRPEPGAPIGAERRPRE
jgi:low temperature requirement protein LtrA